MPFRRCLAIAVLCALELLFLPAAHSDDRDTELERLREAVQKGEVLPLSTLRSMLLGKFPGEIIKTELDIEDDRFVYEFKVLQSDGRLIEVELEAATGALVDVEDSD